jgi:hypothetical protein
VVVVVASHLRGVTTMMIEVTPLGPMALSSMPLAAAKPAEGIKVRLTVGLSVAGALPLVLPSPGSSAITQSLPSASSPVSCQLLPPTHSATDTSAVATSAVIVANEHRRAHAALSCKPPYAIYSKNLTTPTTDML